jgi:hypothetical protein
MLAEKLHILERTGNTHLGHLIGAAANYFSAIKYDIALIGLVEPADAIEQRCFSRPVGPR